MPVYLCWRLLPEPWQLLASPALLLPVLLILEGSTSQHNPDGVVYDYCSRLGALHKNEAVGVMGSAGVRLASCIILNSNLLHSPCRLKKRIHAGILCQGRLLAFAVWDVLFALCKLLLTGC